MGELNLTPPKFDNRPTLGEEELDIITTTGSFLLRFKFDLVKKDYKTGQQNLSFPLIYETSAPITACKFLYSVNDVILANARGIATVGLQDDLEEEEEEEEGEAEGEAEGEREGGLGNEEKDEDEREWSGRDEVEALATNIEEKLKVDDDSS
eukprot:TRINITY_DN9805_c0_g1_i1.p1 TRINITY_DN9805_c0_g1~~TRINITY_DN9805_c0_g1_i1.p1  ORF type:complete len:152 (-),score=57.94 TRINITY_DN9805_c0_g1_i1:155-610(-)